MRQMSRVQVINLVMAAVVMLGGAYILGAAALSEFPRYTYGVAFFALGMFQLCATCILYRHRR